jgi:hypothetical protein
MPEAERDDVIIPGAEYHRLLREDGKASGLAAYILGVLSSGKFTKGMAETIRAKCREFCHF